MELCPHLTLEKHSLWIRLLLLHSYGRMAPFVWAVQVVSVYLSFLRLWLQDVVQKTRLLHSISYLHRLPLHSRFPPVTEKTSNRLAHAYNHSHQAEDGIRYFLQGIRKPGLKNPDLILEEGS